MFYILNIRIFRVLQFNDDVRLKELGSISPTDLVFPSSAEFPRFVR